MPWEGSAARGVCGCVMSATGKGSYRSLVFATVAGRMAQTMASTRVETAASRTDMFRRWTMGSRRMRGSRQPRMPGRCVAPPLGDAFCR